MAAMAKCNRMSQLQGIMIGRSTLALYRVLRVGLQSTSSSSIFARRRNQHTRTLTWMEADLIQQLELRGRETKEVWLLVRRMQSLQEAFMRTCVLWKSSGCRRRKVRQIVKSTIFQSIILRGARENRSVAHKD
eukprot:3271462-Amphidinium_carterae.1